MGHIAHETIGPRLRMATNLTARARGTASCATQPRSTCLWRGPNGGPEFRWRGSADRAAQSYSRSPRPRSLHNAFHPPNWVAAMAPLVTGLLVCPWAKPVSGCAEARRSWRGLLPVCQTSCSHFPKPSAAGVCAVYWRLAGVILPAKLLIADPVVDWHFLKK